MIVCTKCGMHNADSDTFCGQCGSFLEWEGEKVAPELPPVVAVPNAPGPAHEAAEPKAGMVERVKAAIGIDAKADPDTQATPAAVAAEPDRPAAPPPTVAPAPAQPPPPRPGPASEPPAPPPAPPAAAPRERAARPRPGAARSPATPSAHPGGTVTPPPAGPPPAGPPPAGPPSATPPSAAPPSAPTADPAGPPAPTAVDRAPTDDHDTGREETTQETARRQKASQDMGRRAEALLAKPVAPEPRPQRPAASRPPTAAAPVAVVPEAGQPEAVKPGKPIDRPVPRPAVARPGPKFKAGDLICGQCGDGNDPKRNFCHHCGASLKEAVVVTVPWWRRIFQRKPKAPAAAGDRPTGGRTMGNQRARPDLARFGRRILVVGVIVAAIVAVAAPGVRRSAQRSMSSLFGKVVYHYAPISVTKVDAAGSEVPGHGAANVFQGDTNSFWAAPNPKAGTKPRVRVFFDRPHDVALLSITTGDPANVTGSPRPSAIDYQFSDGQVHPPLQVANTDKPQKFKLSGPKASYVDIVIDSVYPVAGSSFYSAVGRIEAFEKKAGK